MNTSAPYGRPLITNIANSTELTACFLLACQLCTPLRVAYGVFCGASYDHQTDYPYKSSYAKAHRITYNDCRIKAKTPAWANHSGRTPRTATKSHA